MNACAKDTMSQQTMTINPQKKTTNKRKASSASSTPSATILKYFKKTPRTMPKKSGLAFGTPSTITSNDSQGTPSAQYAVAAESVERGPAATQPVKTDTCSYTPLSVDNHDWQMSLQTPPSPHDNLSTETPPSPPSETINMGTPSSVRGEEFTTAAGYVLTSQNDEFGTPSSEKIIEGEVHKEINKDLISLKKIQSTSTKSKIKKDANNKARKTSQLYLDLGQKSFASHKICPICSSLIVHGTREDQQNHINICKAFKEGVTCLGFKKERCVGRFGEERILEVREGDAIGNNKVEEVKYIVDKEMGFAASASGKHSDLLKGMTSYLYISKKKVVGLLLVKRINKAYELLYENSDEKTPTVSRGTVSRPAIMGIHQIWVHNQHRHKGIATKLIECARGSFTFGMVIPIEKVAFSSPTEDGMGLAKGFVGNDEPILVYDVC